MSYLSSSILNLKLIVRSIESNGLEVHMLNGRGIIINEVILNELGDCRGFSYKKFIFRY